METTTAINQDWVEALSTINMNTVIWGEMEQPWVRCNIHKKMKVKGFAVLSLNKLVNYTVLMY